MPCTRRRLGASGTSCSTVAVDFLQGVLGEKGKSQDEVPELLVEINRTCALQVVRPRVPGQLPSQHRGRMDIGNRSYRALDLRRRWTDRCHQPNASSNWPCLRR